MCCICTIFVKQLWANRCLSCMPGCPYLPVSLSSTRAKLATVTSLDRVTECKNLMLENIDWFAWSGRINQLSLVPFLGLLWTLWHIPSAPRKTVHGFTFYLVFIAVTIPVGLYCRQHLGTSLANVDWLHGPCEALLTTANLLIVLGLRDALKQTPPGAAPARNIHNSSSSSSRTAISDDSRGPPNTAAEAKGLPSRYSGTQQAAAASEPQRSWEHQIVDMQGEPLSQSGSPRGGEVFHEPCKSDHSSASGSSALGLWPHQATSHRLGAAGPQPAASHHVPHPSTQPNRTGTNTTRSRHVVHSSSRGSSSGSNSNRAPGSSRLMGLPRVHAVSRAAFCTAAVQQGCRMCAA